MLTIPLPAATEPTLETCRSDSAQSHFDVLLMFFVAFVMGAIGVSFFLFGGFRETPIEELVAVHPEFSSIDLFKHEHRIVEIPLRNISDNMTRVVGGTSDCTCVAVADLPMEIPPNQVRILRVELTGGTVGDFTRQVEFTYGTRFIRKVVVTIRGRVQDVEGSGVVR